MANGLNRSILRIFAAQSDSGGPEVCGDNPRKLGGMTRFAWICALSVAISGGCFVDNGGLVGSGDDDSESSSSDGDDGPASTSGSTHGDDGPATATATTGHGHDETGGTSESGSETTNSGADESESSSSTTGAAIEVGQQCDPLDLNDPCQGPDYSCSDVQTEAGGFWKEFQCLEYTGGESGGELGAPADQMSDCKTGYVRTHESMLPLGMCEGETDHCCTMFCTEQIDNCPNNTYCSLIYSVNVDTYGVTHYGRCVDTAWPP